MRKEDYAFISKRMSPAPLSREILKNGVPEVPTSDPLDRTDLSEQEATQIWLSHSREAYALAGIVASLVVRDALNTRDTFPPYGLFSTCYPYDSHKKRATDEIESLFELSDAFDISLKIIEDDSFKRLEEDGESSKMKAIFDRHKKMLDFSKRYFERSKTMVPHGRRTAVTRMENAMGNIIAHLTRALGDQATIDDVRQTAHNSWPYIAQNAAGHLHELRSSAYASRSINSHQLVKTGEGYGLEYTPEAVKKIQARMKREPLDPSERRAKHGCVGLIDYGEGNIVHDFWDWYTDAVVTLYEKSYPGKPIMQLLGKPSPYANI